jgi:hypothetical protein
MPHFHRAYRDAHVKMHRFNRQPKALQWLEAVVLLLVGFVPALWVIEKGFEQPLYDLLFIICTPR